MGTERVEIRSHRKEGCIKLPEEGDHLRRGGSRREVDVMRD